MALLGIAFTETITLGSVILGVLLTFAGLATFGYGLRWKAAYEVEAVNARVMAEGREAFRLRSERLDTELKQMHERVVHLEASRSLEPVLTATLQGFASMEERFAEHERRAQERHELEQDRSSAHLRILQQIAFSIAPPTT